MQRRHFLGTAAASSLLVAGCTSLTNPDAEPEPGDPDPSSDGTGADADAAGNENARSVLEAGAVVDFETAPLTATVANGRVRTDDGLSVTLAFTAPATADAPATLRSTIRNERAYRQTFEPRRLAVLGSPAASQLEDPAVTVSSPFGTADSIYLVPAADHPLAESPPAYDRDGDGRWRLEAVGDDWYPGTITLEADETVDGDHYLLGHHRADDGPIGPGRHRFGRSENAVTVAVWPTDEPGPQTGSRFDGASVPSVPDADAVAWYHDATPQTEAFLEPDVESVAAPARISFTLVNRGRDSLSGNPYYWRLYKLERGAWFPIDPWMWPTPLSSIGPGGVDETELFLYDGEPISRAEERTVGHLGGGRYAYAVGYRTGTETHAALFDLEASELVVGPESDAVIDDGGDAVVIRLPNYEDANRPATLTVKRVDADASGTGDADERLIPEQLPRDPYRGYRNALPLFEPGVETVRVKSDAGTVLQPFGYETGVTRTLEYDGERFEATGSLEAA